VVALPALVGQARLALEHFAKNAKPLSEAVVSKVVMAGLGSGGFEQAIDIKGNLGLDHGICSLLRLSSANGLRC